jgi:hypothetical protein
VSCDHPNRDSVIGTHISECFGFAVGEVRDLIRTVHPFGTRVKNPKKTGFGVSWILKTGNTCISELRSPKSRKEESSVRGPADVISS